MNMKSLVAFAVMALVAAMPFSISGVQARDLRQIDANAVAEYQAAVDAYDIAKQNYKDWREGWLLALDKFNSLKSAANQKALLDKVRDFAVKSMEYLKAQLDVALKIARKSGELDQETLTKIEEQVDTWQAQLDVRIAEVQAATTRSDFVAVIKPIQAEWKDVRGTLKWIAAEIASGKVEYALERLQTVSDKLHANIDKLDAKGINTTELAALTAKFDAHLAEANAKYQAAQDIYKDIQNIKDFDSLAVQVNKEINEAKRLLKDAYQDLRDIVASMKKG